MGFPDGGRWTSWEVRRTDSSTLDHVADGESLYRFVLGCTPRAIGATDRLDVTSSLLISTAVADVLVTGVKGSGFGCNRRTWMLAF